MAFRFIAKKLNILFLTNVHNSMSQRAWLELTKQEHLISVELATSRKAMIDAKARTNPDIIICPFLTKKVPEQIYKDTNVPCLIIHPGVQGDHGISSIDWALKKKLDKWGVTILQAVEEMDAGDIWSSKTFPVQRQDNSTITKSSLYKNEVIETAMQCLNETLYKFAHNIKPTPLDYSAKGTIGQLNDTMMQKHRTFSWNDRVDDIVHNIRFSDSQPGVKIKLYGQNYFAYNAYAEKCDTLEYDSFQNGDVVGQRDGAIAVKASDGLVWIATLKNTENKIKLPANLALPKQLLSRFDVLKTPSIELSSFHNPLALPQTGFQDIWTCTEDEVCYVNFNFSNGACSTEQCRRLEQVLANISKDKTIKCVVLMGGYDTFSNGIHLNVIENAYDPFMESIDNINAIDDVIKVIFSMKDKVTVSAFQGGAGAGGVMLGLAVDYVVAHQGTVLNPHYRLMGLYGSEYWTHFLPRRVGKNMALQLTENKLPISSVFAKSINLVDDIYGSNVEEFRRMLPNKIRELLSQKELSEQIISAKKQYCTTSWLNELENCRKRELAIMNENFQCTEYNFARRNFVNKIKPICSPVHLPGLKSRSINVGQVEKRILKENKQMVQNILASGNTAPGLCIIAGSHEEDHTMYFQEKKEKCQEAGVKYAFILVNSDDPNDVEDAMISYIREANNNDKYDGILVKQPISLPVDIKKIVKQISPLKDVQGCSNYANQVIGDQNGEMPSVCLPLAIIRLLLEHGVQLFEKNVTILGDQSNTLLLPLKDMFSRELVSSTSITNAKESDFQHLVQQADILLLTDVPHCLDPAWIKDKSVVIDLKGDSTGIINEMNSKALLISGLNDNIESLSFSALLSNVVQSKLNKLGGIPNDSKDAEILSKLSSKMSIYSV